MSLKTLEELYEDVDERELALEEAAERRRKYQKDFPDESLTVQADKDRCCVNNILSKYRKTGLIDHIRQHEGRYVDVSTVGDFQDAMNIVTQAEQSFELLPSEIRKDFDNDPSKFLEFVHNPDNEQKLVDYGLAHAKAVEEVVETITETTSQEETAEA